MKKIISLFLQTTLILALAACSAASAQVTPSETTSLSSAVSEAVAVTGDTNPLTVDYSDEDLTPDTGSTLTSTIQLNGDSITVEGSGAAVDGTTVNITSAGTHKISGMLNNGQILVNAQDESAVTLLLSGMDITNSTGAPIYAMNADKVVITLVDGTQNFVTDGASYAGADATTNEPNAAIFSNDDLTINGSGSLTVNANFNDGIASDDDLRIVSGAITVKAVNDGIQGRNYLAVRDGTITVSAGGDGLQASNAEEAEKGFVLIEGGTLNITAGMDGIQAETRLTVNDGNISILSGGGSAVSYQSDESAKGLKAGVDITLSGGTLNIDSADDAIHSNNSMTISGGDITVACGDDGVHSDSTLTINNGTLVVTRAYEGLESETITLNGGSTKLTTRDDGINGSGGADGSSLNMGPGQDMFASSNAHVYINGGYLYVDAGGDGLDSNGSIDMTGGTVIVNGPTNNGNGAIDYNGTFNVTGGILVAVGSSGMAEAPSTSSTQYSLLYNFDSQQPAGMLVHIEAEDGTAVLTFAPAKTYQSVMLSAPALSDDTTYSVYTGGSSTGAVSDGLYAGGTYSGGSLVASFSTSGMVTKAGAAGGMGPGGGPGGPHP